MDDKQWNEILKHMRRTTDDVLLRASEREWISSRQGKHWLKEMNEMSDEIDRYIEMEIKTNSSKSQK